MDADVIVVGAGLAGLVATHELTSRGKKVALVDQENAANLGGQAFWSFGGIFLVDSPEQRRMSLRCMSFSAQATGLHPESAHVDAVLRPTWYAQRHESDTRTVVLRTDILL